MRCPPQAKDRFTDTDEVAAGEHGRSAAAVPQCRSAAVPQSALLEQRDARNSARRVVKKKRASHALAATRT
ncbi:hypothetical protein DIPPA_13393 [Diplonema papillatum]|nr:hypothetical protein DIPPA_13393 [Diplonema papillatum]